MTNNFLKFIFYISLLITLIPGIYLPLYLYLGIDSFILTKKSYFISPIYRKNINRFKLLATPETLSTVSDLVALKFEKKKEDIDPELDFYKEFGADRLDEVELLISIEDEFDINIPNNHFKTLRTIKDISNYVDGKLQVKDRSRNNSNWYTPTI